MTAVNKDPFVRSLSHDGKPHVFRGLVQAGSTQAIKIGEICAFNKTAGYWVPVSAVNDFIYALAVARQEQKSDDVAGYIEFYSLHPDDQFEFTIDAARALALGDTFLLTTSDSQKLTYSATGYPVARCVDDGNYPERGAGTTIRNRSYAVVSFNIACSAWGLLISGCGLGVEKWVNLTAALTTLYKEQSGLCITNVGDSDAQIQPLPQSCPKGTWFKCFAEAAADLGFDPGAAGAIYIENAKQTDAKGAWVDAIGDSLRVTSEGNGDWVGETSITSAADQTAALDIES